MIKYNYKFLLLPLLFVPMIFYSCSSPTSADPILTEIAYPPVITGIVVTGPDSPIELGTIGNPNGKLSLPFNGNLNNSQPIPQVFRIFNLFPNPASNGTSILYSLPEKSLVSIWVVRGRMPGEDFTDHALYEEGLFKTPSKQFSMNLYNGYPAAGFHNFIWNGKDQNGNQLPNGFYRIYVEINGNLLWEDCMIYVSLDGSSPDIIQH